MMNFALTPRARQLLLLLLLGVAVALSSASVGGDGLEPKPARSGYTTPDLIQLAYNEGEISEGQRVLFLAYALYEHGSLPPHYQGDKGWHGTIYVKELDSTFELIAAGDGPQMAIEVSRELARMEQIAATICDTEDGPSSVETGNFHINYGTIGGGLNLQQYQNALEETFLKEITTYGWPEPPLCDATCANANPWAKYPVQIFNIGAGLYGYATQGGIYTGNVGDNPNTPVGETNALATCMVLNSDYAQLGGDALNNLKVTTAHEFFHAIQDGIGMPSGNDNMWFESTAAYVEDEVFNDINDNLQYLYPEFKSCLGEWPNGNNREYGNWLFFEYASERNGGANNIGGGEEVIQDFLMFSAQNQVGLQAYTSALNNHGKNIDDFFHDYAIATRFMRSCPDSLPHCYDEAADYVSTVGKVENNADLSPYLFKQATGVQQDHFSIVWLGLPTTGIYTIALEGISADTADFRVSVVALTPGGLDVTNYGDFAVDGSSEDPTIVVEDYEPPEDASEVVAVITNEQRTSNDPSSCASLFYAVSVARPMVFIVDDTASMQDEIEDARTALLENVDKLKSDYIYPNYHLVTYKDTVNHVGSTNDPDEIIGWLNNLSASGGDDCPEEMLGALDLVAQEAEYGQAWLITDAGFHGGFSEVSATRSHLIDANVGVNIINLSWFLCFDENRSVNPVNTYSFGDEPGVKVPTADGEVGRDSFFQIATETGGHYFRITSSETTSATDVLLSEMTASTDMALNRDHIGLPNAVEDSSFEEGPPPDSGWTEITSNSDCTQIGDWMDTWTAPSYHGVFDFWAGGRCNDIITSNSVSQTVTIPVTSTTLSFQYMTFRQAPDDPVPDDHGYVNVNGNQVWQLELTQANNSRPNWVEVVIDLSAYAGQTVSLQLGVENIGANNGNMRIDYVKMVGGYPPNPPRIFHVSVDQTTTKVNFLLNMFKGGAELEVRDPDGTVILPNDSSVTYRSFRGAQNYRIADPQAGLWEIRITGEGTFGFTTSGDSDINLEYLGSTSWAQGALETLKVRLTGPVDTSTFKLVTPEGELVDTIMLYDDGAHGDGEEDDGYFVGSYTPNTQGHFYLNVEGLDVNADPYTRVATKLIRVHTLQVTAPPGQIAAPGDTIVYDFTVQNTGSTVQTYDLSLSSELGWADLSALPSSVEVAGGESAIIQVTVNVPEDAAPGTEDKATLVAISQENPLVNDSDRVLTTIDVTSLDQAVYLPYLER
jgi:hypothetical protein